MKTQIMLDLETLGQKPGSVIVAIGAVKFGGGVIWDTFYERIDAESCEAIGLRMDASTVVWWMAQSDAARLEITRLGLPVIEGLAMFSAWATKPEHEGFERQSIDKIEVWGNGVSFDNVLLSTAYERAGMARPWQYQNERCYRTVKNMFRHLITERQIEGGTRHNALDDARAQAMHLLDITKALAASGL